MQRAILLRFHKNIKLVQNRIDLLKFFNPEIPIYGLFGGDESEFLEYKNGLKNIKDIYLLQITDPKVKWRFSDIGILEWYRNFGKDVNFDILHTIEYDLVILDRLEDIYKYIEGDSHIYLTNLEKLDKIIPESNWFQNPDFPVDECNSFVTYVKDTFDINTLYNTKAPGATLTRDYLDGYIRLQLPMTGFDEIRLPTVAQILGIEMKDTNFIHDWFDEESIEFLMFNTDNVEVQEGDLLDQYRNGRRKVFHPFLSILSIDKLDQSINI